MKTLEKTLVIGGWSVLVTYFAVGMVLLLGVCGFEPAQRLLLWAVS